MIPSIQNGDDFNDSHGEELAYKAMEKGLSNEYMVFHSFHWTRKNWKRVEAGEADFVIFNPRLGILVVEVKSGAIELENGNWFYKLSGGERSAMKDPLIQAERTKYAIAQDILAGKLPSFEKIVYGSAVWFPSVSGRGLLENLPNTYKPEIVLTEWALQNTSEAVKKAFDFYGGETETHLSETTAKLVMRLLAPEFNVMQTYNSIRTEQELVFLRMTNEQNGLLDYLEVQPTAAIQGSAGTGKTLLAVEKAKRLSDDGKVLFLCFNRFLMDDLRAKNQDYKDRIDFYNLQALVKAKTKVNYLPEENDITEYLNGFNADDWAYKSIVIDEGQDFENEHLELLSTIAESMEGSFYAFYDKNQLIQRRKVPECLQNAECRLILRRNCRNTQSIAKTAASPIGFEPFPWEGKPEGEKPAFYILPDVEELKTKLAEILTQYIVGGIPVGQIVILTVANEKDSLLYGTEKVGKIKLMQTRNDDGVFFTTVRKFKGLEAVVVVMIDVGAETFLNEQSRNLFYVGASRAKHFLDILAITNDRGKELAAALTGKESTGAERKIAKALKVKIK